jgi:hypothetical protein
MAFQQCVSLSHAPEIPVDFEYTNDQVPGQWSFDHNPFMTAATYKIYIFAPGLDRMALHKNGGTYFYDPAAHDFELDTPVQDLGGNQLQQDFDDVSLGLTVAADERISAINTDSRIFTLTIDAGTVDRTPAWPRLAAAV